MSEIRFQDYSEVTLIREQANDHMIASDARLSTALRTSPENPEVSKKDAGLVRALMRERHGTPFEAPQFTFEIHAPIFVAREAHRHRMASISEVSGRYVELRPVFWVPPFYRPLVQTPGTKQMDYALSLGSDELMRGTRMGIELVSRSAWRVYQDLLESGVTKEVARVVLPTNLFTTWRLRINLRSALNFLSLRTRSAESAYESKPQLEIAEVADQMEEIIARLCPIAMAAFNEFGRVAP